MYALIINGMVLLFDMSNCYGLFNIKEVNLNGYQIIEDYRKVLNHYKNNYFDVDMKKIEQYTKFLFRICKNYLKDLSYV